MGCAHSKPPRADQGAAVALCRDRSALLAEAIRHRYALADAHRAYAASLRAAGAALHDFLQVQPPPPPEPTVRLAEHRKGDTLPAAAPPVPAAAKLVDDNGGHIRFTSDDDEEGSESDDAHISFPSSSSSEDEAEPRVPRSELLPPAAPAPTRPAPPYGVGYAPPLYSYSYGAGPAYGGYGADIGGYGQSFFNISYARSRPPPPSVSYEHRPQSTDATVQYYPGSYYGGYQYPQGSGLHQVAASSCEGAGPPPSPPRVSTWEFLNPFESVASYYGDEPTAAAATSRPSSKDAQEEVVIPKLEDEKVQENVVNGNTGKAGLAKKEERSNASEEQRSKAMSPEANNNTASGMVHDVHVVERSLVEEHLQHSDADGLPEISRKAYNDNVEVAQEIRLQFDLAAKSAAEVSKMLEVGKMPYYQKKSGLKVSSSMMICGLPSIGEEFLQFQEEKAMECGNISSTLQKLYMWEKKLLEELKTEEKMRGQYDKKREELKVLYERGAEAQKLEAIEIYTRKLSTKISVALQVVNVVSKKINKLRDEELWPQTFELIQGYAMCISVDYGRWLKKMWHAMSECHQIQWHALSQAKNIDSNIAAARFSEAHIGLMKQLELQLLDLVASFAAWVNAQKSYINTINDWLKKGIDYVPEVTDDGTPPFSPGRLGAPPIFIICNNWAMGITRIPETEVVDAMQDFASNVLHLWEKHRSEWRQSMMANRDMDRELRVMERDELSMRKALKAQNKKFVLVSNHSGVSLSAQALQDGSTPAEVALQSSMKKYFEAMECFAASCANAYNDLHRRSEEERTRPAQDIGRAS
ncbi:protein ALTERED PHOSPHATE STARVATION RESPONSE 1-like [Lolium rigidum]|uniref:protein ALTERED PHOSPHATE STARVATION RESPONSE 1-like n=1 Tax=Lolium rigidum TaxID=89674 RepID=UPI001F5D3338|nr:protein ALTERED PHOSPHATE STARVATION RESPONSE 1-like [Lolium rigidum]